MNLFPVIEVSGNAFERGRMHGAQAAERIERSLANYRTLFEHCGLGWDTAQAVAARYAAPIRALDPGLYEEIEGIAAGAGRTTAELLALNARTEILPPSFPETASPEWIAAMTRGADPGECTAIAVQPRRSTTGGALLAQNWDWLGSQRDSMILLRVNGSATDLLTLTEAGMLAKIGLNRHGFGVCLNILRSNSDGLSLGVPVHVVLRRLLDCVSVAEAEALARRLRHPASSNILCADAAGGAASLELSPRGVGVVRDVDGALCHTNHFLDASQAADAVTPPPSFSTEARLAGARRHAAAHAKLGLPELQRLLRDESDGLLSICRKPDPALPWYARVESVASVIMELDRGVMHVAPDVPSRADYQPVALASHGEVAVA